jgi:hypothetical protein
MYTPPESSISGSGRYIEFSDAACNLVANDNNCQFDISEVFVRDLGTHRTSLISVATGGVDAQYPLADRQVPIAGGTNDRGSTLVGPNTLQSFASTGPTISDNGRYAVFVSTAMNLVPNTPAGDPVQMDERRGVYLHDLGTDRTYRMDVESDGEPFGASEDVFDPSISADGRYVAMYCGACGPVVSGVEVYDWVTGALDQLPVLGVSMKNVFPPRGSTAWWNGDWTPGMSADGRYVSLTTYWTPKTQPLLPTSSADVFEWDRGKTLGAGRLVSTGRLAALGSSAFRVTGEASAVIDTGYDALSAPMDGLALTNATLRYRADSADLFVRMSVGQMPATDLVPPGTTYSFDLVVSGRDYEVRAVWSITGATFGLFDRPTPNGPWTHVANLSGGFGTTGDEIVVSLPLTAVGAQNGGRIGGLTARVSLTPTLDR